MEKVEKKGVLGLSIHEKNSGYFLSVGNQFYLIPGHTIRFENRKADFITFPLLGKYFPGN